MFPSIGQSVARYTCLESNHFITDAFHGDCGHSNLTHQCNRSSETQIYGTRFRYTKLIKLGYIKLSQALAARPVPAVPVISTQLNRSLDSPPCALFRIAAPAPAAQGCDLNAAWQSSRARTGRLRPQLHQPQSHAACGHRHHPDYRQPVELSPIQIHKPYTRAGPQWEDANGRTSRP